MAMTILENEIDDSNSNIDLSPNGHMLPKIRRDAREGIVTKKFTGERLIRNNLTEIIDPELQPICPQCGVEGNFVAQFEGQLFQTAKGIQVKFIHSKGDNNYPKDQPEIEDFLDIECNHCGGSFFLNDLHGCQQRRWYVNGKRKRGCCFKIVNLSS